MKKNFKHNCKYKVKNKEVFVSEIGKADYGFRMEVRKGIHNLVHPDYFYLFYYDRSKKDELIKTYLECKNNVAPNEPFFDFPHQASIAYYHPDTLRDIGYGYCKCYDNKIRRCKKLILNFQVKGIAYSEVFYLDHKLCKTPFAGVISSSVFKHCSDDFYSVFECHP